jgi:rhamnose transport system permease protein
MSAGARPSAFADASADRRSAKRGGWSTSSGRALKRYRREWSVAAAIGVLAAVLAAAAPGYFAAGNLSDLFLANMPVLIVALGATLVILAGEIDISVGSVFAICGVVAGITATLGMPVLVAALAACAAGGLLGALNGVLVAYVHIPSIVVTLATMVAWRDGLRWTTEGRWVENLPPGFQWLGLSQGAYPAAAFGVVASLTLGLAWALRQLTAGRAVYATGSNPDAARLAGLDVARVKWSVFVAAGTLTGLAALLNSVRFNQIPSNAGLGLEMKVIAAVVVGGTAIGGGRGTLAGTVLGVILLGAIGPALTFLGVSAYWERAIQGAIILTGVAVDYFGVRRPSRRRRFIRT